MVRLGVAQPPPEAAANYTKVEDKKSKNPEGSCPTFKVGSELGDDKYCSANAAKPVEAQNRITLLAVTEKFRSAISRLYTGNMLEKGLAYLEASSYRGMLALMGVAAEEVAGIVKEVKTGLIKQLGTDLFNNIKTEMMSMILGK